MSAKFPPGPTAGLARTPAPPYWAVVFTSLRTDDDDAGYGVTAQRMVELVGEQAGFLGIESVRGSDGLGITVGYFASREAIAAWGAVAEHRLAQELGQRKWYRAYTLRTCRVEDERHWTATRG